MNKNSQNQSTVSLLAVLFTLSMLAASCGPTPSQPSKASIPSFTPIPRLADSSQSSLAETPSTAAVEVGVYDPSRDPAEDLRRILAAAQTTKKNILMEIGCNFGNVCTECPLLDYFFAANPEVLRLRKEGFLLLKVNFSPENFNHEFLYSFPPVMSVPYFYVLDSSGKVLHTQYPSELMDEDSYSVEKFSAFLRKWSNP